jgi:transposase
MVWKETCAVDERMRFVLAVEAGEEAVAALCRRSGISRRVGYKWLSRYRAAGGLRGSRTGRARRSATRRRSRRRSPSVASRSGERIRAGVR